jgi:hypothetical protein
LGSTETHKPFKTLLKVPPVKMHQLQLGYDQGKTTADLHQGRTKDCVPYFVDGGYDKG